MASVDLVIKVPISHFPILDRDTLASISSVDHLRERPDDPGVHTPIYHAWHDLVGFDWRRHKGGCEDPQPRGLEPNPPMNDLLDDSIQISVCSICICASRRQSVLDALEVGVSKQASTIFVCIYIPPFGDDRDLHLI